MNDADRDLAKRFRKEIRSKVWPVLKSAGFDDFAELAAWRHDSECIDCVQFQTLRPPFGYTPSLRFGPVDDEYYPTPATFMLVVGTYYRGVHSLPWLGPVPTRPSPPKGERRGDSACHRRISLARSMPMGNLQGTTFYVYPDGSNLVKVLEDALKALEQRGLPWLETTRDINDYIDEGIHGPSEARLARNQGPTIELSGDHRQAVAEWIRSRTSPEGFQMFGAEGDLLAGVRAAIESAMSQSNLSDHVAMDQPPYGEDLLGLLVSRGRWDEALAIQRQAADADLPATWVADSMRRQNGFNMANGLPPSPPMEDIFSKQALAGMRRVVARVAKREQDRLRRLEDLHAQRTQG